MSKHTMQYILTFAAAIAVLYLSTLIGKYLGLSAGQSLLIILGIVVADCTVYVVKNFGKPR